MIVVSHGNLLTAGAETLVNTVGVMGRGTGLRFERAYPGNHAAHRAALRGRSQNLAVVGTARAAVPDGGAGPRPRGQHDPAPARTTSRLTEW